MRPPLNSIGPLRLMLRLQLPCGRPMQVPPMSHPQTLSWSNRNGSLATTWKQNCSTPMQRSVLSLNFGFLVFFFGFSDAREGQWKQYQLTNGFSFFRKWPNLNEFEFKAPAMCHVIVKTCIIKRWIQSNVMSAVCFAINTYVVSGWPTRPGKMSNYVTPSKLSSHFVLFF